MAQASACLVDKIANESGWPTFGLLVFHRFANIRMIQNTGFARGIGPDAVCDLIWSTSAQVRLRVPLPGRVLGRCVA